LAVKAFLVNGMPVLIGLAGFELHGFPANAADWESWFRGDRDVGHELVSRRESSDCTQGTDAQRGTAEGCVKRLLSQSHTRDAPLNTEIGTAVTETGAY
jgi:hypothetical protein